MNVIALHYKYAIQVLQRQQDAHFQITHFTINKLYIKGKVHPKTKILSSFQIYMNIFVEYQQRISNIMNIKKFPRLTTIVGNFSCTFLLSIEHKRRILKNI